MIPNMNLQDLAGAKEHAYREMCKSIGLSMEQAKPLIDRYEQRLENLVETYKAGVQKAATKLQQDLTVAAAKQKESDNGSGQ